MKPSRRQVLAGAKALYDYNERGMKETRPWAEQIKWIRDSYIRQARACLKGALNG